jgi:4a-hydroxytetrahydrobiopterin dehydratase
VAELATQRCEACTRDTPLLTRASIEQLTAQISPAWRVVDDRRLQRTFRFSDFAGAFALATRIAGVAEQEGHHPELTVGWGHLDVDITTHIAGGLTRNDFILAAKIDRLLT